MEQITQQKINFQIPSLLKLLFLSGIILLLASLFFAYILNENYISGLLIEVALIVLATSILSIVIVFLKRNFKFLFQQSGNRKGTINLVISIVLFILACLTNGPAWGPINVLLAYFIVLPLVFIFLIISLISFVRYSKNLAKTGKNLYIISLFILLIIFVLYLLKIINPVVGTS